MSDDAIERARKAAFEEAARMLEMSKATIRLHCGEMTAQEMRSVKAVLKWKASALRDAAKKTGPAQTTAARRSFDTKWSDADGEYVGLCDQFPSLSWLAPTSDAALRGIMLLVADIDLETTSGNGPSQTVTPGACDTPCTTQDRMVCKQTGDVMTQRGDQEDQTRAWLPADTAPRDWSVIDIRYLDADAVLSFSCRRGADGIFRDLVGNPLCRTPDEWRPNV